MNFLVHSESCIGFVTFELALNHLQVEAESRGAL